MSDKFCLKWNDFTSNVSKSFGLFRNAEYLHDVTLVSDDNKQVSAHKLVLSACSEYFKNIFQQNNKPNAHPLLCLDGISSADLENIVEYIYNGKIQIYQDQLDRFLEVAQRFRLEGLLSDKDEPPEDQQVSRPFQEIDPPVDDTKDGNVHPAKARVTARNETHVAPESQDLPVAEEMIVPVSTEEMNDIKDKISLYLEKCDDGKFRCTLCGKTSLGKTSNYKEQIKSHIEGVHLEGISIPCQLCGKSFRSRNSLNSHKSQYHK